VFWLSLKTRKAIHEISRVLDLIKGMGTGYTTSNDTQLLLSVDNTIYRVTLEELAEGEIDFPEIDKYLKLASTN
jgi:hypothetical protein